MSMFSPWTIQRLQAVLPLKFFRFGKIYFVLRQSEESCTTKKIFFYVHPENPVRPKTFYLAYKGLFQSASWYDKIYQISLYFWLIFIDFKSMYCYITDTGLKTAPVLKKMTVIKRF